MTHQLLCATATCKSPLFSGGGNALWNSFEIYWQTLSFPTRQIRGQLGRSLPWPWLSALELSMGTCWKKKKQMVLVHNYFSLKYHIISSPCKGIIKIDLIWKLCHQECKTIFYQWGFPSQKKSALADDKLKQQIILYCTWIHTQTQARLHTHALTKQPKSEKAQKKVRKKHTDFGKQSVFGIILSFN